MIHYDLNEVTELTRALVAIRSFPGEEHAVQQYIVDWFAKYHIPTEIQPTKTAPNIIVRIENGDGPTIMLNGHTDTVLVAEGWECDPFVGKIDGENFYGLGACDMKSGVAAIMLVTREMFRHKNRWSGTLIFSSVVDEEAYSVGAYALIESGIKADYCIVSEPMPGLVLGATGKVLVKADVIGKAAHGFMPWMGVNAASEGSRFVVGVDQLPLGTHERIPSSQSVLSFLSGSAQYVVTIPERAEILVSRQIVPGETKESVLAQMQGVVDGLKSPARIELSTPPPYYPSYDIDPQHRLIHVMQEAYRVVHHREAELTYSTGVGDANLFNGLAGIPSVNHGPTGGNFHQCNEWVNLPSIAACCVVYTRALMAFMGKDL